MCHGALLYVAPIPFYRLAFLPRFSPVIQLFVLRAGYCCCHCVVSKISRTIASGFVRASVLRLQQHLELALGGLGHLGTAAIAAISHGKHCAAGCGVLLRLFYHAHQFMAVGFFHRDISRHRDPMTLIHHRLSIVSEGLSAFALHAARFRLLRMVMLATILFPGAPAQP